MAVDCILVSEMVSGVPSCSVGLYPEEMKFQRRFIWIATFDIAVFVTRDKKFTVPTLVCDHACGGAYNAWLCLCALYAFDPSLMLHAKCLLLL